MEELPELPNWEKLDCASFDMYLADGREVFDTDAS